MAFATGASWRLYTCPTRARESCPPRWIISANPAGEYAATQASASAAMASRLRALRRSGLLQMNANVLALLSFYMNPGFTPEFLLLRHLCFAAGIRGRVFSFALDQVIGRIRGHPLGEFAAMVGNQIPRLMLFALPAD